MWDINFKSFFTILNTKKSLNTEIHFFKYTSKQVRIPGHVVTTDALQRLCITHVHTKKNTK